MADVYLQNYSDDSSIKKYIRQNLMSRVFHDIPMNVLNTGAFSIISEYISQATEQLSFTSTFYFNESFITKAVLPDSIYAEAAIFDIGYSFANPSSTEILLELRLEDLFKNATFNPNTQKYEFILDKDTQFNLINGNVYSLDYDILFQYMNIDTAKNVSAPAWNIQYINMAGNVCAVNKNPYIVYRVTDTWLCLFVRVSEYKRTRYLVTNSMTNGIPNEDYIIEESNNICGFDVTYIDRSGKRTILARDHILPIHDDVKDTNPYIHYIMDNPHKIRLMFQLAGNRFFIPQLNSQFEIIVYSSHGYAANFTEAPKTQPNVITATSRYSNNANVMKAAFVIGPSVGGTDIGNAETVRRETIEAYNTANVISTDHDIDEWLKTFYFKNILYPFFFKRRDDPWGRIWSGFLALKDSEDNIYKTNTLHGRIPYNLLYSNNDNSVSSNEIIIPPGWLWKYTNSSKEESRYIVVPYARGSSNHIETADTSENISEHFLFANPFGIRIQKSPFAIAYFNPWINTVVVPTVVPSMNTISPKDVGQNELSSIYHATPIDVEITRTYKDNYYHIETYIDVSQLTTVDGKAWVNCLLKNAAAPELDDIVWTYFKRPLDVYAKSVPMLINNADDGYISFDPDKTYLCVKERNTRDDGSVTLSDVWIDDQTDPSNPKQVDVTVANVNYIFGRDSMWGDDNGIQEPVAVTGTTAITCYGMTIGDFYEFTRQATADYYALKLKSNLMAINPDGELQTIAIKSISVTVEKAVESERTKYGESKLYNIGNKYRDVKLNILTRYVFTTVQIIDDIPTIVESEEGGEVRQTYTIRNAVDVSLPYATGVSPIYTDGMYTFTYPVTADSSEQDSIAENSIIGYASMKPAPSTKTVDYYRIQLSKIDKDIAAFYLSTSSMPLEKNNLRVILHAYLNGAETGRVEMLPVERDTDGTYLFRANMYPTNQMIDIDNMIHVASTEYGGGNWIPTKNNSIINIDAIHPELRISVLFKSTSNPDRVSDIVTGDEYTGYIRNDQYYVNGFSLVQELKEMRSVVNFNESSIPTEDQAYWYNKMADLYEYSAGESLYNVYNVAYKQMIYKEPLTDEERAEYAEVTESVSNTLNQAVDELSQTTNIIDVIDMATFQSGIDLINLAFNKIIDNTYEERYTYKDDDIQLCYAKLIATKDEEQIEYEALEKYKEDHPMKDGETLEEYNKRIELGFTSSTKMAYIFIIKQSINEKDYSKLYSDEACTAEITPEVGKLYVVQETNKLDSVFTYNRTKYVENDTILIWENIYNILNNYINIVNTAFAGTNINGGIEIQLIPFVEYSLMMNNKFKNFVATFTQVHKALEPVIFKRLEGNNYLDCKLIATYGLPHSYCSDKQYYLQNDEFWPDLNIQLSFSVKLYNRALSDNTLNELRKIVKDYFNRLTSVHTPAQLVSMNNNIYISHVIQRLEQHSNVAYLKFNGWYTNEKNVDNGNFMNATVQSIVQKWRRLEDMKYEELERYVPEMFVLEDRNIEINIIDDGIIA